MKMQRNLKQSCDAKYTYSPQGVPCIQQRHVVMIPGASRKSNLMSNLKFPQEKVFTSCKCVVYVKYSEIKDVFRQMTDDQVDVSRGRAFLNTAERLAP